MDTTTSSSKRSPPIAPRIFGVALSLGLGLWLATAAVGMASAQTAPQTAARVSYADLDLSSEAGARALLYRIRVAASSACGQETHSPLFPRESARHRACVNEAVGAAVNQIGSPTLTAVNNGTRTQAGMSLAAR